jgi:fatty-acid peroxygenase
MTKNIPHITALQAFTGFLHHGYNFIHHTCETRGTKIFAMELLAEDIICFSGAAAAELFYDAQKFERRDALPRRVRKTLVGDGGVQTLDGAAHGRRKEMFMSIASPERVQQLTALVAKYWALESKRWDVMPSVPLHARAREVLCRAACAWTGVPLPEEEVALRADDLYAMVDAFGAIGCRHRRGRRARKRIEAWMADVIGQYRNGIGIRSQSAMHMIAMHRDADGQLLDRHVAAVELINIVRPIVAIATFVTFSALALHDYPHCAERLRTGDAEYMDCFIQEVRRFYPFAPFVGARVRDDFTWDGYVFPRGALVLLDIYGTNHDASRWHLPGKFDPRRFFRWDGDPFDYIPHGGGSHLSGHRCAGEALTADILKVTLQHLTQKVAYTVPDQDLSVDLTRIPTLPKSGFVLDYTGPVSSQHVVPPLVRQSRFNTVL